MADFKSEKNILGELIRAREAIKRKYSILQQEKSDYEKKINDNLKPVISPLEKLIDLQSENSKQFSNIDSVRKPKKRLRFDESIIANNTNASTQNTNSSPNGFSETDYDDDFASAGNTIINSTFKSVSDKSRFVDNYISLLDGSRNKLDNIYGVRKMHDIYMIGDSPIDFDEKTVTVRDVVYPKTGGLMELLFKKQPDDNLISSQDQENYRSIMEATNAHRKRNSKDETIRVSKSRKYTGIIAPMFHGSHKKSINGTGLLPAYKIAKMNSSIDLVYWDDPNELVERLRLLIAERSAGNNNHGNEIQSIIEELREGGYIF